MPCIHYSDLVGFFFYVLLCSYVLGAANENQSGRLHVLSAGSVILQSLYAYQETVSGGY